jgi:hypothetical protein
MRKALLLVALVGLATLQLSQAINYIYDELLYTKQFWEEYKLDFPYSIFKEHDEVIARAKDSLSGLFLEDSLSGPQSNLQELIEQDLKRGDFQPNSFDVSLIDDTTPLPGAASVAQCKTCLALATVMWQGLVEWSHRFMGTVAAHDLIQYGESLCEYEVPEVVLKEWVVLSARVHGNVSPDHPPQQFYMLSVRHRQHARVREIQVVRAACKALLSNKHAAALEERRDLSTDDIFRMEASPLLKHLAEQQKVYLAMLREKGAVPLEKSPNNDNGREYVIGDDDIIPDLDDEFDNEDQESRPSAPLPKVQRECFNKHPQCEYWAERGECRANPGYMVGTETTGWCRAACFVCTHPQPLAPGGSLPAPAISDLDQLSADLFDSIQTTGCTKSTPCRGIDANAAAKSRLATAAGVDPDRTAALQKVELISGPIEAESFGNAGVGAPGAADGSSSRSTTNNGQQAVVKTIDSHLLDDSMVTTTLPLENAVIPKPKDTSQEMAKLAPVGKNISPVQKALWEELNNQCLYITNGWWSYEMCYLHSTTQFHMPGGQNAPEWIISLGHYASSDWEVRNMTVHRHKVGLFPVGSVVPYVSQQLESGNICELTGEDGVNSLTKVDGGGEDDTSDDESGSSSGDGKEIDVESIINPAEEDKEPEGANAASSSKNKKLRIGDQVLRTTTVRFMCSPDTKKHIAVVEPEQCRYVVDVYVPALCRIKGMVPVLPEFVAAEAVPSTTSNDKSTASGSTEIDPRDMFYDDDPYVDPDEWEELELKRKAKQEKKEKEEKLSKKDEL